MQSLRILVVEDDDLVGLLLAEMLSAMGHQVQAVVTTERAAIEAARQHAPDLIILDENLRSGHGSSAISHILQQRAVPYVLMSGNPAAEQNTGAAFLEKPFFEEDLHQAIQTAWLTSLLAPR